MSNLNTTNNPVFDSAIKAANTKIDGFEDGTNSFNGIGAKLFRSGDNQVINQIRRNRQNIQTAREALEQL